MRRQASALGVLLTPGADRLLTPADVEVMGQVLCVQVCCLAVDSG